MKLTNCQECGGTAALLSNNDTLIGCTQCHAYFESSQWNRHMASVRAEKRYRLVREVMRGGSPVNLGEIDRLLDEMYGRLV